MNRLRHIVFALVLLGLSGTLFAKPKMKQPELTAEEQMRLDYYLYAALDASDRKSHAEAYFLLELCYQIDSMNPTVCSMIGAYRQSLYGQEQAFPLIKRAYEGSPHDYWYRYTVACYEAGQKKAAVKVLQEMEKREPKNTEVLELHEQILKRERNYKQALVIRDKIDKLTGEPTVYSVVTRYDMLQSLGLSAKAQQTVDEYIEHNPHMRETIGLMIVEHALQNAKEPMQRLQLLVLYGDMLGQQERYPQACAAYEEALKMAPDLLGVLNNYAWTLAISGGDLKRAEMMSQRTIQKDGNNPTFLDTYAWILHLQGQDTLALFYMQKALEHADGEQDETLQEHFRIIQEALQQ